MFEWIISLGWYCGTAASMAKHGVRSISGPFDWQQADFKSILHFMETDFSDFLKYENLELVEGRPLVFYDKKYDVKFPHDVKYDFEAEFLSIQEKYIRRINKFREVIKSKTCFIRIVRDIEEMDFIENNEKYILDVITKSNGENHIIFLFPNAIPRPKKLKSNYFVIEETPLNPRQNLRTIFDCNPDLITYLQSNFPEDKRKDNLIFDLQSEYNSLSVRYSIIMNVLTGNYKDIRLPDKVSIYGASQSGKIFYDNIKDKCSIIVFLDANPTSKEYDGIPIIKPTEYDYRDETIIVTPIFAFNDITNILIKNGCKKERIISLDKAFGDKWKLF